MLSAVAARRAQQLARTSSAQTPGSSSSNNNSTGTSQLNVHVQDASPRAGRPSKPAASSDALKRKRRAERAPEQESPVTIKSKATVTYEQEIIVAGPSSESSKAKKPRRAWSPSQPVVPGGSNDPGSDADSESVVDDGDVIMMNAEPVGAKTPDSSSLISSYTPKTGENFFPSLIDGGHVLLLEPPDTLCFTGTVSLTVLHGSVEVLGTTLTKSSVSHSIFAPKSSPLPVITCSTHRDSEGGSASNVNALGEIHDKLTDTNCAVLLKPLQTGVEGMGKVCGTFDGVFDAVHRDAEAEALWCLDGFHLIYSTANNLQPHLNIPQWSHALDSIASLPTASIIPAPVAAIPQPIIALMKGSKRTGKSTFARMLTNRLCSRFRRVAYLDCDLGQSEFSPGGMVSIHLVSQPVLGPSFTHPFRPFAAHYVGATSPRSSPTHYVACIAALLQTYRLDLQYAAIELDGDESEDDLRRSSLMIPLVVNTQGWTKGMGADLMREIEEMVGPTHVFEFEAQAIDGSRVQDVRGATSWAEDFTPATLRAESPTTYTLPAAPSGPLANFYTPSDMRAISLLSYFHARDAGTRWRTDVSLLATPPYEVDVSVAFDKVVLTGPGSEDVVYDEVLRALNCSVVALVEQDDDDEQDKQQLAIPYVQGAPSPDPSTSRCHGLAFIRAISRPSPSPALYFHLLTPVPPSILSRCRLLVKGEMDLPIWAFIGSSSEGLEWKGVGKGDEGGTVGGVRWDEVPYLAFRGGREVVGSGVRKARKNVMRRGQM